MTILPFYRKITPIRKLLYLHALNGGKVREYTLSGEVVSFTTNMAVPLKSLVIGIDPVQDLHGYDNPWPAGGGVNKVKLSEAFSSLSTGVYGFSCSFDGERIKIAGTYSNPSSATSASFRIGYFDTTNWDFTNLSVKGFVVSGITSSNVYTNVVRYGNSNKTDLAIDLINLTIGQTYTILIDVVFYEGSTAPTSWTPYSNICPITGWTGANVSRTGVNLFDKVNDVVDGYITSSGVFKSSPSGEKTISVFVKAGTYTLSKVSTTRTLICYFAEAPENNATGTVLSTVQTTPRTVTVSQDGYFVAFVYNNSGETNTWEDVLNSIMLELGSTASSYEAYTGQTYPISWQSSAGTVYGGTLDVRTGVLTVDMARVDLGDLSWTKNDSSMIGVPCFYATIPSVKAGAPYVACSDYTIKRDRTHIDGTGQISPGNGSDATYCVVRDDRYATGDAHAFKSDVSGVQLVYEFATPLTYQLTPTEVTTLLGRNNVWADTGDTTLTYQKKR